MQKNGVKENVASLLVVEDEEDLLQILRFNLAQAGFSIKTATNGNDAIKLLKKEGIQLALLDIMLPDISGLDILDHIRKHPRLAPMPVILLSAKGEEADIVTGLESGADDYIVKPFRQKELIARINSLLRRKNTKTNKDNLPIEVDNITIDRLAHTVKVSETFVSLTSGEFDLLFLLMSKVDRVLTRTQIIDALKCNDNAITDRAVDVQIVGLRRKLADAGRNIETVRGIGYCFRSKKNGF